MILVIKWKNTIIELYYFYSTTISPILWRIPYFRTNYHSKLLTKFPFIALHVVSEKRLLPNNLLCFFFNLKWCSLTSIILQTCGLYNLSVSINFSMIRNQRKKTEKDKYISQILQTKPREKSLGNMKNLITTFNQN